MSINKKKVATSATAIGLAGLLLLGGSFAWQSISQTALNEASDVINPGGRLHDDFNGENKDVYVENFANENIYARIRLDEYFKIIQNKGTPAEKIDEIAGTMDTDTGEITSWATHYFDSANATDEYWEWLTGGSTIYMPTFNKNKDSLLADINGTYNGNDGVVTDEADDDRYEDYVEYADGDAVTADAEYDADSNDIDDGNVETVSEEHIATSTLDATLMSMQEWIDAGSQPGEYWVYDTDGWVYWAQAIEPDTATGLLLDGIGLTQVMDDSWYYAINVVAQFITADDLGKADNSGFYADGETVSDDALTLLESIGVDISGESSETDELLTLVLSQDGVNEVTIARGASVKISAEDDGADLSAVLIDGSAWDEDSDWTYDPETCVLTLNGYDSYYGVFDASDRYSGTVNIEREPVYYIELSDRYVNPGDTVTVTVYNEDNEEVQAELSVSGGSTVNENTVTIADDTSGEVTVTATVDGVTTDKTLFVASSDANLKLSIAPGYEKDVYTGSGVSLNITAMIGDVDVFDYIDCNFDIDGPDGNNATVEKDEYDDEGGYRLRNVDVPGWYSITINAEGASATTENLLFDHDWSYEIYVNDHDTIGGRAFLPIGGTYELVLEREYYDWDMDPYLQKEFLTVDDGVQFEVSAGSVDADGIYTPVALADGESVGEPVCVTAKWTDEYGYEHTAVTSLASYDNTKHELVNWGGGSINDDTYDLITIYLFGDTDKKMFNDEDGNYYCILIKRTDYDDESIYSPLIDSTEMKKYYTNEYSFSGDDVHSGWDTFKPCNH